jgi:hypothetical protein
MYIYLKLDREPPRHSEVWLQVNGLITEGKFSFMPLLREMTKSQEPEGAGGIPGGDISRRRWAAPLS